MTMPVYNLDDRRWADLVDEGRALIPLYAPDWTDQNAHDPGVTILELFAWIAEMDVYGLNRITDSQRRKFLALVGLRQRPPRPARTVLALTLKPGNAPLPLPPGVAFEGTSPFNDTVRVRTLGAVTVVGGALVAVQVGTGGHYDDMTDRRSRGEPFAPFGSDPQSGAALYLGFDAPLPPHIPLSLAFTATDPDADAEAREALIRETSEQAEACRRPDPSALCGPQPPKPEPEPEENELGVVPAHYSVRLAWEYLDGAKRWVSVSAASMDSTRALTLNGRVVLTLPGPMGMWALGHVATKYAYVRCRLVAGAYDAGPTVLNVALNGVEAVQAVHSLLALKATVVNPNSLSPLEHVGDGTGWPDQSYTLSENPVVSEGVQLYTRECIHEKDLWVWHPWRLRTDFDGSGPADRDAVLDAMLGVVTFGNGEQGLVPQQGEGVYASYLATLAAAGNLAPNRINALSHSPYNSEAARPNQPEPYKRDLTPLWQDAKATLAAIDNPVALAGGAAAETLDHAEGRAFGLPDRPTRAVTLADYEALAAATPGVRLARVRALANVHPHFPCIRAPGVVALIVLPFLPLGRPAPSDGLLRAVAAYLARRRVIGTRVEVVGPNYMELAVQAGVQAAHGTAADLPDRVVAALTQFFDPLTGGPAGTGWPFGRDVVRTEVLAVIARTPGVDHVTSLALSVNGGPPQCGNVCVGFAGLVASGRHQVTVTGAS